MPLPNGRHEDTDIAARPRQLEAIVWPWSCFDPARTTSILREQVKWHHAFEDEPVVLYSERDDERWETRKVEMFRNGRCGYASAEGSTDDTMLGLVPTPPLEEIAVDPQFEPSESERAEFERMWASRRES